VGEIFPRWIERVIDAKLFRGTDNGPVARKIAKEVNQAIIAVALVLHDQRRDDWIFVENHQGCSGANVFEIASIAIVGCPDYSNYIQVEINIGGLTSVTPHSSASNERPN
jgi:hypothetical protein